MTHACQNNAQSTHSLTLTYTRHEHMCQQEQVQTTGDTHTDTQTEGGKQQRVCDRANHECATTKYRHSNTQHKHSTHATHATHAHNMFHLYGLSGSYPLIATCARLRIRAHMSHTAAINTSPMPMPIPMPAPVMTRLSLLDADDAGCIAPVDDAAAPVDDMPAPVDDACPVELHGISTSTNNCMAMDASSS